MASAVEGRPGFERSQEPDQIWQVDARFAAALREQGWPAPDAVARCFGSVGSGGEGSEGRGATAILALPGHSERLHLRPVRHGGLLGPLWAGCILGFERPLSELRVTETLRAAGAPVPRAVSVVAHRRFGPLWEAIYATEHVEDAADGLAWLARAPSRPARVAGARAVGAAIRRFHDAGGQHPDLHIKNLLLRGTEPEVWVIDLDGARADAPPTPPRRMQELMRLVRSLHKRGVAEQIGVRGLAAGFSAYCGGDRGLRGALWRCLPREQRRMARHAWAYRGASAA
ncbi:MAG: lipopolysaccharide kinase InaA family protein [Myxococcota bacterium]